MFVSKYVDDKIVKGKILTNYEGLKKETNLFKPGVKYHHVGQRSDTLSAALDRDLYANVQASRDLKYGGASGIAGRYSFKMTGANAGQPLPFDDRLHYPGANQEFTVLDGDLLEEEYKLYQEREEYINKIVELCIVSDEQCMKILGLDKMDELKLFLGAGTYKATSVDVDGITRKTVDLGKEALPSDEVYNATAVPSILNMLPSSHLNYSFGIAKLKAAISYVNPVIKKNKSKSVDVSEGMKGDI
jgi:hypothetical protein